MRRIEHTYRKSLSSVIVHLGRTGKGSLRGLWPEDAARDGDHTGRKMKVSKGSGVKNEY